MLLAFALALTVGASILLGAMVQSRARERRESAARLAQIRQLVSAGGRAVMPARLDYAGRPALGFCRICGAGLDRLGTCYRVNCAAGPAGQLRRRGGPLYPSAAQNDSRPGGQ